MTAGRPTATTFTGLRAEGRSVALRCEDGLITALGPEVEPQPGDQVVDTGGGILSPPLVNGHTHAAMTLFRGFGDDLPLMRWLEEKIWPIEAKLEPEDVYWGARLAAAEMTRTGTTRLWDMYWHPTETARAMRDAGLRATIGAPLINRGRDTAELQAVATASLDELADPSTGLLITPALAPHAIYTVGPESLRFVAELSTERNVPVQIHLSETEQEVHNCVAANGVRPARYLDDLGLLSADVVLAHGVWLDEAELELIAARGATVVSNPAANMKLAVGGTFPYPAARLAGVHVGLGTDGPGSNNSLDLFADTKLFALAQKHAHADAAAIDAGEAWAVATGSRAPLLGATPLEPGEPADFLILDPDALELALGDPESALVYTAGGHIVDTTVVAGKILMRGGVIEGLEEIVTECRSRAARLGIG